MHPTAFIGRKRKYMDQPIQKSEIKSFIQHLFKDPSQYKPSLKQIIYFQVQKVLALKILETDKPYWVNKGWDKQIYFYPCKIPWWKKLFAKWFFKRLWKKSKPRNKSDEKK
jgi:hypothetical protein